MGSKYKLMVAGFNTCPFFQKASTVAVALELVHPQKFKAEIQEFKSKDEYKAALPNIKQQFGSELSEAAKKHTTSPFVYKKDFFDDKKVSFIGGCDSLLKFAGEPGIEFGQKM